MLGFPDGSGVKSTSHAGETDSVLIQEDPMPQGNQALAHATTEPAARAWELQLLQPAHPRARGPQEPRREKPTQQLTATRVRHAEEPAQQ